MFKRKKKPGGNGVGPRKGRGVMNIVYTENGLDVTPMEDLVEIVANSIPDTPTDNSCDTSSSSYDSSSGTCDTGGGGSE